MCEKFPLQDSSVKELLSEFKVNSRIILSNRIVMAPMTRSFADKNLVPTSQIAEYYARRSAAGLIISEGTIVRKDGQGYPFTPGIYSQAQIEGWKKVTEFVHEKEGKIFCQLWHSGRVSHPKYLEGNLPVAPSVIPLKGIIPRSGRNNALQYGIPRELKISEIQEFVNSFVQGAINAISAGFDGVEIHGAHGYLIDEFLHYDTNKRTDNFGGSPENMSRFLLEILDGMIKEIGNDRIGVRLSPSAYFNLEADERDDYVFKYLLEKISILNLAYVHQGMIDDSKKLSYAGNSAGDYLRTYYKGILIGNGNYTLETAAESIRKNKFDLISFGKLFISNPGLVEKIKSGEPLLPYNSSMLKRLI